MIKSKILERYSSDYRVIKEGDYVMVTDGSYMVTTEGFKSLSRVKKSHKGLSDEIFIVLTISGSYPTDDIEGFLNGKKNNIMIRSLLDNEISFCSNINLTKIDLPDFSDMESGININKEYIRTYNINKILNG